MWVYFKTGVILLMATSIVAQFLDPRFLEFDIPGDPLKGSTVEEWCKLPCGSKKHYACDHRVNVALPFQWPPSGIQPLVAGGQLPVPGRGQLPVPGGGHKPVDDGGQRAQSPPTPQNSTRQKRDAFEAAPDCDVSAFLSPKDRAAIANTVNDFRNSLATSPPFVNRAANMRQVTWDYKLELFANIMATNDDGDLHIKNGANGPLPWVDEICARTEELPQVSAFQYVWPSNIFQIVSINDIFAEIGAAEPDKAWISNLPNPSSAARTATTPAAETSRGLPKVDYRYVYTMMASANATKIGCSYGQKKCSYGGHDFVTYRFNCFMGSGVNEIGSRVFQEGDPCTKCPSGTSCNENSHWPKLCARQDPDTEPDSVLTLEFIENPRTLATPIGSDASIQEGSTITMLIIIAARVLNIRTASLCSLPSSFSGCPS